MQFQVILRSNLGSEFPAAESVARERDVTSVQSPPSAAGGVFARREIALATEFSENYSRRRPSVHKELVKSRQDSVLGTTLT